MNYKNLLQLYIKYGLNSFTLAEAPAQLGHWSWVTALHTRGWLKKLAGNRYNISLMGMVALFAHRMDGQAATKAMRDIEGLYQLDYNKLYGYRVEKVMNSRETYCFLSFARFPYATLRRYLHAYLYNIYGYRDIDEAREGWLYRAEGTDEAELYFVLNAMKHYNEVHNVSE